MSKTRTVVVPKELHDRDLEVIIWQVGGEWRSLGETTSPTLTYEPWRRGPYWALACTQAECFVIAATRLR